MDRIFRAVLALVALSFSTFAASQKNSNIPDASASPDAAAVAAACGGELYPKDIATMTHAAVVKKISCFTREAAKRFNATLPSKVDDSTTLESVSATGVILTYHYVVNLVREDLRPGALAAFKPTVRDKVCGASDMAKLIKYGAAYKYEWLDRNGKLIGTLLVDKC